MEINNFLKDPNLFDTIKESDIEEVSKQLYPFFQTKIDSTAEFVTNKIMAEPNPQSRKAFAVSIKEAFDKAIYSYVANEKWKVKVPITPYLNKSLFLFAKTMISNNEGTGDKIKRLICPACRERKIFEILSFDGDILYCKQCEANILNSKADLAQLKMMSVFAKHSKNGVKCPNCSRFVPLSAASSNEILHCPYPGCDKDCTDADEMKHPVSVSNRILISLNNTVKPINYLIEGGSYQSKEFGEKYCSSDNNACVSLITEQEFANDVSYIRQLIEQQKKAHAFARQMPNKPAMYDAFLAVLEKYPQEMVSYLTAKKQSKEISIQSVIYQEFAKIMKTTLPIKIYSNGNEVYIDDVLDEKLHLFSGIREFSNFIDQNSVVKRRQQYNIKNSIKEIDTEDAFIGEIISVKTPNGEDVSNFVDYHGFTSIRLKFDPQVKPGNDVIVKYYSLQANYTLGSMIHLQRIKKKIVESITKKMEK